MVKVAINGFGRIGRNAFKIAFERNDLEVVAVNDLTDTETLAHLLKYDSSYGTYDRSVEFDQENIVVDGKKIRVLSEKDPAALPWQQLGIDVVIESPASLPTQLKPVLISTPALKKWCFRPQPKAKARKPSC